MPVALSLSIVSQAVVKINTWTCFISQYSINWILGTLCTIEYHIYGYLNSYQVVFRRLSANECKTPRLGDKQQSTDIYTVHRKVPAPKKIWSSFAPNTETVTSISTRVLEYVQYMYSSTKKSNSKQCWPILPLHLSRFSLLTSHFSLPLQNCNVKKFII
jgi:hypothetical protein